MAKIAKKYDANLIVDDAHSVGVIGEEGIGTDHILVSQAMKWISEIGTFSKSLASLGGFVASTADVIDYLKHTSRSLIFSASMTPSSAASVIEAMDQFDTYKSQDIFRTYGKTLICQ